MGAPPTRDGGFSAVTGITQVQVNGSEQFTKETARKRGLLVVRQSRLVIGTKGKGLKGLTPPFANAQGVVV